MRTSSLHFQPPTVNTLTAGAVRGWEDEHLRRPLTDKEAKKIFLYNYLFKMHEKIKNRFATFTFSPKFSAKN